MTCGIYTDLTRDTNNNLTRDTNIVM